MIGPDYRYNGKAYSAIITSKNGVIKYYHEYNASLAQDKEAEVKDSGLFISGTLKSSLLFTELLMFVGLPALLIVSIQGRKKSLYF